MFNNLSGEHIFNFKSLQVTTQNIPDMTINISPGGFWSFTDLGKIYISYPGDRIIVINKLPRANYYKWVVVCLDNKGSLILLDGEESIDNPLLPMIANNRLPLAAIYMHHDMIAITLQDIYDIRPFFKSTTDDNVTIQKILCYTNEEFRADRKKLNFIDNEEITFDIESNNILNSNDITVNLIGSESAHFVMAPSDTVTIEKNYGMTSSTGIDTGTFSREDHTHGSPTNQVPSHNLAFDHSLLHSPINDPTHNEKLALNAEVTPNSNNKYITNSDFRLETNIILLNNPSHNLIAFKIITNQLTYASNDNSNNQYLILGMNIDSITSSDPIARVQLQGYVRNVNWNWNINKPIYLGLGGNMTQTKPTSGFIKIIAIPISNNEIILRFNKPAEVILPPPETTTTTTALPEIINIQFTGDTLNPTIQVEFNMSMDPNTISNETLLFNFINSQTTTTTTTLL
jgi:hypothetical protein